jgi:hypothetical protein
MATASIESLKRIEGVVANALSAGQVPSSELERERTAGSGANVAALGALFGSLEALKSPLKSLRGGTLSQTDTFKLVDHWGRLTALSTLLTEIEDRTDGDGEGMRAKVETFWRGITDAALSLTRDYALVGGLSRYAELTDWVLSTARAESEGVAGSIKRMVARG